MGVYSNVWKVCEMTELLDGEEEKEDIRIVLFPGRKWVIKSRINKSRDSNINMLFRWKQVKMRKYVLKQLAGDWTQDWGKLERLLLSW